MTALRVNPFGSAGPPEAEVTLLPDRAVWWPSARTLLVADLHLGKCETMRANGTPMPESILASDLARLVSVIARTEAARVVVLGDLLHASIGVTPWLLDEVGSWRRRAAAGVELAVVPGNHDGRLATVADAWGLRVQAPVMIEGPFALTHEPRAIDGAFVWAGHLHPLAAVSGRGDSMRLPCFWLTRGRCVLPAFSAFTGGVAVRRIPGDRVLAIADGHVVEV